MDPKTRQQLDAAFAKKTEIEKETQDRAAAAAQKIKDDDAIKKAVPGRMNKSLTHLKSAIKAVNEIAEAHSAHFEIGENRKREMPDYAQLVINLIYGGTGEKPKQIILNVDAMGYVRPVFLTTHTARNPHDFDIENTSEDFYEAILADFLEQTFSPKQPHRAR